MIGVLLAAAAWACGGPSAQPTAQPANLPTIPGPSPQPATSGRMWIGIEYAYPEAAPTFRDSGATSAKPYPDLGAWNAVQPQEDGAYRWGPIDRFVKAFQEAGFRHLTLMLRDESPWASVDPPKPPIHRGDTTVKPEYEADFSAYVQAYVERYDADGTDDMPGLLYPVLLYGFEPEFSTYVPGDAESYIHMAGLAYAAVKRANPEAQMMNAALLLATIFDAYPTADEVARRLADPDPRVFDKSPADIALVLDHPELFDILDVHALADYTEIIPTVAWLRQEMARRGYDRPIWIGDTWGGTTLNGYGPASCPGGPNTSILAYPATEADRCEVAAALSALADSKDPDHDEAIRWIRAESAAGTVRKIMVAAGEGLAGINMGNVEDWEPLMLLTLGGAGTSPWQGMLDRNMLTKTLIGIRPSFYALQQVATLLKESTRVERVAGYDEKTYVYAVELADGRSAYVVWADVGLWLPGQPMPTRPVRLTIPGASEADVEWTITEGDTPRRESLPLTQNVVELHVGSAPAFLYPVDGSS